MEYKIINGKPIELYSATELKDMAKQEDIKTDNISIGIWAKCNGFKKVRKQTNKVVKIYYYNINEVK